MDTDDAPTYAQACPSRTVIEVLANKWSLYILGVLGQHGRPMRFTELRRQIEGVTQKSLTKALRNLERDGLISRTVYPTIPPRVEYALTDLGSQAGILTTAIADWSLDNASSVLTARSSYDNRPVALPAPVRAEDAARASPPVRSSGPFDDGATAASA